MKRIKRNHALTLLEALIVVLIIGMLAAMLYPVFESLKMKMRVVGTVQRMKQFHIALQMYRQDWGGADVFTSWKSFSVIGLPAASRTDPTWMHLTPPLPGISRKDWIGPCGYDVDRNPTAGPGERFEFYYVYPRHGGSISYAASLYAPVVMEGEDEAGNYGMYWDYISTHRDQIVVLAEFYCNPPSLNLSNSKVRKRGIALLLSGQVVNKSDVGSTWDLRWFSD
ncbi:MAG: type II secretion system protein [Armatimonadota bacterium]